MDKTGLKYAKIIKEVVADSELTEGIKKIVSDTIKIKGGK